MRIYTKFRHNLDKHIHEGVYICDDDEADIRQAIREHIKAVRPEEDMSKVEIIILEAWKEIRLTR